MQIICTKESVKNGKSIVPHVHAIQHKPQWLTKKLLLKGPNTYADASADASAATHKTGTNIPVTKIICNTTPMQIFDFVEDVEETWSDDEREEELWAFDLFLIL